MVEVYLILGDHNVRKSSTVRALTGIGNRGTRTGATITGNIDVYIEVRALQENNIQPSDFTQQVVPASGCQYVLVPLRIQQVNNLPSGNDYIQHFITAGWTMQQVVVLGMAFIPPLPGGAPNPNFIPQAPMTPANNIASQIRGWWGWL
jgi:hypothetical protein